MAGKDSSRLSNIQPFTAAHRAKVQEALSSAFLACLMFRPSHLSPSPQDEGAHFDVFSYQKMFNENSHPTLLSFHKKNTFLNCLIIQHVNYVYRQLSLP